MRKSSGENDTGMKLYEIEKKKGEDENAEV